MGNSLRQFSIVQQLIFQRGKLRNDILPLFSVFLLCIGELNQRSVEVVDRTRLVVW